MNNTPLTRFGSIGADAHSTATCLVSAAQPTVKEGTPKSPPKGYPERKDKYADPNNFRYPIDTAEHARAAWSYINQTKNQADYKPDELKFVMNRIKAACKKFGIQVTP